jgi:hypothetical protein
MADAFETAAIARRVAARLAETIDAALPDKIEEELLQDPFSRTTERLLDPISVASLILSLVAFGWTVYHDLKRDRAEAAARGPALAERVAGQLRSGAIEPGRRPSDISSEQEALIVKVVAEEIVAAEPSD